MATFNYDPSVLAANSYPITAVYSGDATYATSTSAAETLTVSGLPTAATPTFSLAAGTYSSSQTVTISDATSVATIYFTNDGSTPTTSSAIYSSPIAVNSTQTLQAIAGASGFLSSSDGSATYTSTASADYQVSVNPSSLSIAAGKNGRPLLPSRR